MKKVVFVIANSGFQDREFSVPYEYLRKKDVHITVAAGMKGDCFGVFGKEVQADTTIDTIDAKNYDMIIYIGGGGAYSQYFKDSSYLKLAREAKKVAAICISPMIISDSGILLGKRYTCWDQNGLQIQYINKNGGVYVPDPVVVSGNVITANGPGAAEKFVEKIREHLK